VDRVPIEYTAGYIVLFNAVADADSKQVIRVAGLAIGLLVTSGDSDLGRAPGRRCSLVRSLANSCFERKLEIGGSANEIRVISRRHCAKSFINRFDSVSSSKEERCFRRDLGSTMIGSMSGRREE
jgi:hypothetical protein